MTWQGAYSANDKCPVPEKGWPHESRDSVYTDNVEDYKLFNPPVHVHMHVVTIDEWKTIMMVLIMPV